jgi:hypothetical protein
MKKHQFIRAFITSILSLFIASLTLVFFNGYIKNTALASVMAYLIMTPIFIIKERKYLKECIKDFKYSKDQIINIVLYSALFIVLANFLNQTLQFITHTTPTNNDILISQVFENKILILQIILLAPILEELIFRAPYQGIIKHKLLVYIFYSVAFASVHLLNVDSFINYIYFFPYFLLALGIGFSFYKTNNILLSIIVHIINNLLEIMLLFI